MQFSKLKKKFTDYGRKRQPKAERQQRKFTSHPSRGSQACWLGKGDSNSTDLGAWKYPRYCSKFQATTKDSIPRHSQQTFDLTLHPLPTSTSSILTLPCSPPDGPTMYLDLLGVLHLVTGQEPLVGKTFDKGIE